MSYKGLLGWSEYPQSVETPMTQDKSVQGKDGMGQKTIEAQVTLQVQFMWSPLFNKLCFCRRKWFKPKRETMWCVRGFELKQDTRHAA